MSELFIVKKSKYNLRNEVVIASNQPSTTKYGINSISHLAPKIWEIIPDEIRSSKTVKIFKDKIKRWIPENCLCRLCKIYVQGVGFV